MRSVENIGHVCRATYETDQIQRYREDTNSSQAWLGEKVPEPVGLRDHAEVDLSRHSNAYASSCRNQCPTALHPYPSSGVDCQSDCCRDTVREVGCQGARNVTAPYNYLMQDPCNRSLTKAMRVGGLVALGAKVP